MIIKVEFRDKNTGELFKMMFGTSYKTWGMQYLEYLQRRPEVKTINIWRSASKWIGWGGLKWCREEDFQEQLNLEGEGLKQQPRLYSDMKFSEVSLDQLLKFLK